MSGASEVLDVWVLEPYQHTSAEGLPVRFDNRASVPDGTTYEVWTASLTTTGWSVAGQVTAAGDSLEGDVRIHELGTVALVRP